MIEKKNKIINTLREKVDRVQQSKLIMNDMKILFQINAIKLSMISMYTAKK